MPYKDPAKQREFQRKWIHKRRVDHFKGKKCARCGKPVSSSTADLDHKSPKRNRDGHKIWSHSKKNRSKEIKKTQILCKSCHKKKTKKDKQRMFSEELVTNNLSLILNEETDYNETLGSVAGPTLQKLENHVGNKVYLVGGAVRDAVLGDKPKDLDYVTVSTPEHLGSRGWEPTGDSFPVFRHKEFPGVELALARSEEKTGTGYKGFNWSLAKDIHTDLGRRDFTINAMAWHPTDGLVDPYNGVSDLKKGLLRHVTDAFAEDPLRVLRGARFSATKGMDVAPETIALMHKLKPEVALVDKSRVRSELTRALTSKNPRNFFDTLKNSETLDTWFPEVNRMRDVPAGPPKSHPEGDTYNHTMLALQHGAAHNPTFNSQLFTLLHDVGKAETPEEELPRHIGHEKRGADQVDDFTTRFQLPAQLNKAAKIHVAQHMRPHQHDAQPMRPGTAADYFTGISHSGGQYVEPHFDAVRNDASGKGIEADTSYVDGLQQLKGHADSIFKDLLDNHLKQGKKVDKDTARVLRIKAVQLAVSDKRESIEEVAIISPTLKQVYLATGNPRKAEEFERIIRNLGTQGIQFLPVKVDTPELQQDDFDIHQTPEIAKNKAISASGLLGKPVAVEDSGLYTRSKGLAHGFPGWAVKQVGKALGNKGLHRAVSSEGDPSAAFIASVGYASPGDAPRVFSGITRGRIVSPHGEKGFGFDPIFTPSGANGRTFADMDPAEKDNYSARMRVMRNFASFLRDQTENISEAKLSQVAQAAKRGIAQKVEKANDKVQNKIDKKKQQDSHENQEYLDHSKILFGSYGSPDIGKLIVNSYTHKNVPDHVDKVVGITIQRSIKKASEKKTSDESKVQHIYQAIKYAKRTFDKFNQKK